MPLSTSQEEGLSLREWLPDFFRQELSPYPGRWSLVARMVTAATLSMIVIVTFRIPYGAIGVNCAFILSRENLTATAKSGFYFILAFAAWVVLMPVGARMFASVPITHFLWEAVTIFLCFFFLKTIAYFPLATGIVIVASGTMTIWYLPGPAELNVELTLWQILATAIGALITLLVEVVFRYFSPRDATVDGIDDRLRSIEEMLRSYELLAPLAPSVARSITQYAMTGTSLLRRQLARSQSDAFKRATTGALIALVARAIDVSAAIVSGHQDPEPAAREPAESLRLRLSLIRESIHTGNFLVDREWPRLSLSYENSSLAELNHVVSLMESVLESNTSSVARLWSPEKPGVENPIFVRDAFSNPEYLRFALAGTAAAMLCYIVYVGLNWPGISTSVTTCLLTALSNIGSSRQKQLLRITGATIGGFVFGLGSQIFILPYVDSIVGLTILFGCVTAASAYVATSSPRFSYVGLQMAFAFYLINVTDFSISLDLTIGRDRAIGVLLGIVSMWLVFERLYSRPAAVQMVRMFAQSVRLIASLRPVAATEAEADRILNTRDGINNLFTNVNAEADAVLFESGEQRAAYLAARDRVRRWTSTLRTLYILQLPLLEPDGDGAESAGTRDAKAYLWNDLTESLNKIAACLEHQVAGEPGFHVRQTGIQNARAQTTPREPIATSSRQDGFPVSFGLISKTTYALEEEVLKDPVFAT